MPRPYHTPNCGECHLCFVFLDVALRRVNLILAELVPEGDQVSSLFRTDAEAPTAQRIAYRNQARYDLSRGHDGGRRLGLRGANDHDVAVSIAFGFCPLLQDESRPFSSRQETFFQQVVDGGGPR